MTAYKPGDVVLIAFPFTDFSTLKQRPCIVISSNRFNTTHNDVIVAAITSHLPEKIEEDEYLLSEIEQRACGLPKASMVKLGKIVTIDTRLIRKSLGQLPEKSCKQIFDKIYQLFNIN
jgi:mRNA interferase MazF